MQPETEIFQDKNSLQEQYIFIHDAILESITCGNTQISAANLQIRVNKLKQRDGDTNLSGYEQQFKVPTELHDLSPGCITISNTGIRAGQPKS